MLTYIEFYVLFIFFYKEMLVCLPVQVGMFILHSVNKTYTLKYLL